MQSSILTRHNKTHTKPYHCDGCNKSFALRADLERHKSTHRAVKLRFKCKVPGCKFKGASRKDNLQRHILNSHGEKLDRAIGPRKKVVKALCQRALLEQKQLMEASNLLVAAQSGND